MENRYFILDDQHNIVAVPTAHEAYMWGDEDYETRCKVGLMVVNDVCVSTVFLMIDHGQDTDKPVLFETLVIGGEYDRKMKRYYTWDEALAGHHEMCAKVFASV